MPSQSIAIVDFSDSFADLWTLLAADLGVEVVRRPARQRDPTPADAAVVILAAGGAEREVLEWLDQQEMRDRVPVLVVGADPSRRMAVRIVGHGARDYFALPEDLELLRNAVEAAVIRQREMAGRQPLAAPPVEAFSEIIGESKALLAALSRAARLLPHGDATALIVGETGTGKELLARALHAGSPRGKAPFVPVNCAALPKNLIESELFGHERGAFTDAHAAKPGLFELADGGTLFLDEVGTLPFDLQAKLLRVLEDGEVRRVGATKSRKVNVRIVAATNENLQSALRDGQFRQDLYFRVGVVTLTLPPLRERGDDVVLIAEVLVERLAKRHGLAAPAIDADVKGALRRYHWPGNVRELKNAIERALLLSPAGSLAIDELVRESAPPQAVDGVLPFPAPLDEIAAAAARSALELCDGNRSEAARRLKISRRRLRRLLGEESLTA